MAGDGGGWISPGTTAGDRRDAARRRVVWLAKLHTARGGYDCRVSNISPGGARVRVPETIGVGQPVTLVISGHGEFFGVIAWERDSVVGIRFTDRDLSDEANQIASAKKHFTPADGQTAEPIPMVGVEPPAEADGGMGSDLGIKDERLPSLETMPAGKEPVVFVADDRVAAAVAILHPAINEVIDPNVAVRLTRPELRKHLVELLREITQQKNVPLSRIEYTAVVERILDEMLGLGPLEPLLADDSVTDILVNGPKRVFVERKGKLAMTDVTFVDDQHVINIALRIVTKVGRRIDESVPLVDARLPDGSRVNVIVPPLAIHGPMISIRKFSKKKITLEMMARQQNLSPAMATLLKIAARSRLNILISGGTGSGKTTLLNAMSQNIDPTERIITIEDAAELQLQLPHVGSLEARPANIEGKGAVTMRDLFKNALRMRPDRIILGEIRSDEAFDVLQAMNTGHDGSLATIHASGPREALARLESIIAMCGIDISTAAIRQQISSAIDLIVQVSRMRDGKRRITHITEVVGQEGAVFMTQDLFTYQYESESATGDLLGRFVSSGLRPYFMPKAERFSLHRALLETMSTSDSVE